MKTTKNPVFKILYEIMVFSKKFSKNQACMSIKLACRTSRKNV